MLIRENLDGSLEIMRLLKSRGMSYGTMDSGQNQARERSEVSENRGTTSTSATATFPSGNTRAGKGA